METKTQKSTLMTEGSIYQKLIYFAVPLILGNFLQQMYSTVDSIMVGNFVGAHALAAVSSCAIIIIVLVALSQGIAVGAGVVIAQCLGAQNLKHTRLSVHTAITISVIFGVFLTLITLLFSNVILVAINTPDYLLQDSNDYMFYYGIGLVFSVIYNMVTGVLNAAGNSKRSLIYLAWASILNIVLDYLLICVLDGGIKGAAIASTVSQFVACVLSTLYLMRVTPPYKLMLKALKINGKMLIRILRVGLPTGIQGTVITFSNVLIQAAVNSFGYETMAGFGVYLRIDGFNILPILSISMAISTFVGQNIGAKRFDRVHDGIKCSLIISVIYTGLLGALALIFGHEINSVFTDDVKVLDYAYLSLWYFCPFYIILAVMYVYAGSIRGTGKALGPMIIILSTFCIFRVFWILCIMPINYTFETLILVYPLSWIFGCSAMYILHRRTNYNQSYL